MGSKTLTTIWVSAFGEFVVDDFPEHIKQAVKDHEDGFATVTEFAPGRTWSESYRDNHLKANAKAAKAYRLIEDYCEEQWKNG